MLTKRQINKIMDDGIKCEIDFDDKNGDFVRGLFMMCHNERYPFLIKSYDNFTTYKTYIVYRYYPYNNELLNGEIVTENIHTFNQLICEIDTPPNNKSWDEFLKLMNRIFKCGCEQNM